LGESVLGTKREEKRRRKSEVQKRKIFTRCTRQITGGEADPGDEVAKISRAHSSTEQKLQLASAQAEPIICL
jgi:hypothetical protein